MMQLEDVNIKDSSSLYILFYIQGKLFTISTNYVVGITPIPNDIILAPSSSPNIYGICSCAGDLITVLNTPYLLNLLPDSFQQLIVLSTPPSTGLIVGNVIGIEKSQNMHLLKKPPFLSNIIPNYYLYKKIMSWLGK